jgi:hypothetical protein
MKNLTNGMSVLGRRDGVVFIRLPDELAVPIAADPSNPGVPACRCPYCKAHPELTPKWDTLAVQQQSGKPDHTWTVHMPDHTDARA